ncbi:MAG: polysaccharide lyase family protein, partial [Vicinamibacteraceae bacterium]
MTGRWLRFLLSLGSIAVLICIFLPGGATPALSQGELPQEEWVLWRLGTPDGSSMEFAPAGDEKVAFRVGRDVPAKDFPAEHRASVGLTHTGKTEERPYTITFDLEAGTPVPYELVLDLIYPAAAPDRIKIRVNGRQGVFPVQPTYKPPIDSSDANAVLLAKQSLVVPIDDAWLKPRDNRVTITPLGISRLEYDAITLRRAWSSKPGTPAVTPTVLFVREGLQLEEILELYVPFEQPFTSGEYHLQIDGEEASGPLDDEGFDFGMLRTEVRVPAFAKATEATVSVTLDGRTTRARQALRPEKQWKIYVNPKVHNDVGFTDIQPHVNELDTRNTDTVLEILERYPFYTFNFETGWLVDNYLDSRTEAAREEFFEWARKGRATLSAFYLNLLTGIASGEELYRATYFAHRLHREHETNFDFACLTDAPSHSWFLPTLLTDIGIKSFANGSNQTRAPILQHSDLNEQSPFYWEGMNGERILKWYSRSYLQLGILTGEIVGSPSVEYLRASIPQFMRRFQRKEYVPDAVMVYGAWVDNAAIPADGLAPLIERWNSTYEYPKLLVTSDAEYFDYIDSTFRDRLPVYRGDAGAYWEDGAASTAKATKMNRQTKEVITAAETVASFGSLFDSRYRYPAETFREAWDNIMFYDEHTWGALQSIDQPGRELVTRQWEIKENYALDANLSARNILARSLNRLVQHVAVESDMVFAFNLQSRARSGPVEVELDEGRYLVDLATNTPV